MKEMTGRYSTRREDRAIVAMLALPMGSFLAGCVCGFLDRKGIAVNQDVHNAMLYAPAFVCAAFMPIIYISQRSCELEELAQEFPKSEPNQRALKWFDETPYEVHQMKAAFPCAAIGFGSVIFGRACGKVAADAFDYTSSFL